MKKDKNIQANYRLPESLLRDLKEVAEAAEVSQALIVKEGVQSRIRTLKRVLERRREAEAATA